MADLLALFYVQGEIIESFFRLFLLVISFDFFISFANAIKSIKGATV